MKKVSMALLFALTTIVSFGQVKEDYVKDDYFYTTLKSGVGEITPVKFKLGSDFLEKLPKSENYILWEKDMYSNPENAKAVELNKDKTHIEAYLSSCTWMASFYAKLGLKNGSSYTPIANSEGFIYVNDKGEVSFSFPFKGQNGYGNMLIATAYYTEKIKNGKRDSWHGIGSN
jgi:hypothetical protein